MTTTPSAASAASGTQVTFKLTVKNAGPDVAYGVTLADALPATEGVTVAWTLTPSAGSCDAAGACTLGDLADGASIDVVVTGTPTNPGPNAATLTNSATVDASNLDSCTTGCTSTADIEVTA